MQPLKFAKQQDHIKNRKRFFEKRYLPFTEFPATINALEEKGSVSAKLTSAYRLYGYEISGGGVIHKFPRYHSKRKTEREVLSLLLEMLNLKISDMPRLFPKNEAILEEILQ